MAILRHFATVGGWTMGSRVLGFLREALIANIIGTGPVADAFYAAFAFPNLFRRLFAEGALNSAFIPLFSKKLEESGGAARLFASQVCVALLAILLVLSLLAEIFMPHLVSSIIAIGFDEQSEKFAMTVQATRIMFPYLLCMSLVALLSGILNTFHHYKAASFAPVLLNIVMVGLLLLCYIFETGNSWLTGQVMAWGVFCAGFLQLALMVYALYRTGFRIQLGIPKLTSDVKSLLILALPVAISGGITQINLLVGQNIASLEAGAISVLRFADRIYQLPLGVIGIAIGVVLLPELSRQLKAKNWDEAVNYQNQSLEFGWLLTLPASVALFTIPEHIVDLLFGHGAFNDEDVAKTAMVLQAFALGLPAFVLIKVFQPGFFARENTKTPMRIAALNAFINIALSLSLFPIFGLVGIAIATSVAGWVNAIALYLILHRNRYWQIQREVWIRLLKIIFISLAMGLMLSGLQATLDQFWPSSEVHIKLMKLIIEVPMGVMVYFALIHFFHVFNLEQVKMQLMRR